MKYFICLHILFVLFVSCKKETIVIHEGTKNITIKKGVLFYNNMKFTGKYLTYYQDHTKKAEIFYREGKKDGMEKIWFPNGILSSKREFSNGIKTGLHEGWWENGNKKFEFYFNESGQHHGAANDWFKDGTPYKLFNYVNGKEEGSQKMFKPNGDIRANYVVVSGERFGLIGLKKCDAVSTL